MNTDERIVNTEEQSNVAVNITPVDAVVEQTVDNDDAEILEVDANVLQSTMIDDTEILDVEEESRQSDLQTTNLYNVDDSISPDIPVIVDILEPTELYQPQTSNADDAINYHPNYVEVSAESVVSIPTQFDNVGVQAENVSVSPVEFDSAPLQTESVVSIPTQFDNVGVQAENVSVSPVEFDSVPLQTESVVSIPTQFDNIAVQEENIDAGVVKVSNVNRLIPKKYVDYKTRVAIMGLSLVVLFGLYLVFFVSSLAEPQIESINYRETSNLDYKVYLKENDFYESSYLNENMVYVASLIDNISVDFNYKFDITEILDLDLSYDIVGKLIISDTDGKKRYFDKEYQLLNKKAVDISSVDNYSLKETVLIDYDYYNGLANQFKMNYGVETKSTLQVFLKINKKSNDEIYNINDDSVMSITIPLSTKSVEIGMDYNEIDEKRSVVKENIELVHNKLYMALAIIFGLSLIVVAIKLIRFLSSTKVKKSVYDNYVEKLLREYDRLIVENFTGPDLKNSSIVTIKNFDELLDVRDGLRLPILYYVVAKHQKCYFYVKNGNEIYLMTIKAVDLEKESKRG